MTPSSAPLQFLILLVASRLRRRQAEAIEYLRAENRVLRARLGPKGADVTCRADGQRMAQVARHLTDAVAGPLRGFRHLIVDRDPLYTAHFETLLASAGVQLVRLPARSPTLNAYAERFVRSIRQECLRHIIPLGERQLRTVVAEFVAHYHAERNHQGLGNVIPFPSTMSPAVDGRIRRRERLGGPLKLLSSQRGVNRRSDIGTVRRAGSWPLRAATTLGCSARLGTARGAPPREAGRGCALLDLSSRILQRMLRLLSILGALATGLLAAPFARASVSAHLVYVRSTGAETCPDEEGMRRAVKERVGYDPFFPWAKTTVVVEVSNDGQAFVAHIQLVDDHSSSLGTRDLRSVAKGCGGLIDAAALAISIALELNAPTSTQPTSTSASSPIAAAASSPEAASEPSAGPGAQPSPLSTRSAGESTGLMVPGVNPGNRGQVHAHADSLRGAVGADLVSVVGESSEVVAGFDVWAAVRSGVGALGLELRGNMPSTVTPAGAEARANVLMVAATLAPCAHVGPLFACALGTLGWLHASGDVSRPRSGSALAFEMGPRAGVELTLTGALALRVHGDFMVDVVRPGVFLEGKPWTIGPLSGEAGAGLAYRFP